MDPCPFLRIVVRNLAVKYLSTSNKSDTSFYCKIKIKNLPTQISNIPLQHTQQLSNDQVHASFCLNKSQFEKLNEKSNPPSFLKLKIYKRELGCGLFNENLYGYVLVDLKGVENKVCVIKDGWVEVDKNVKLCLNVRVEPDPRFVFEFDGKPECSPQVFQVNGNVRQAVFTCKFGFKNSGGGDRSLRSRLVFCSCIYMVLIFCIGFVVSLSYPVHKSPVKTRFQVCTNSSTFLCLCVCVYNHQEFLTCILYI